MNPTLTELDREWRELCRSTDGRKTLERWGQADPTLAPLTSLEAVLEKRKGDPDSAPTILAALARLSPVDKLAARTLLQALLPGIIRMASTAFSDDPAAVDELVSLAWERIRTYPTTRLGSVAANVLWDVRKRYCEHRNIEAPHGVRLELPVAVVESSVEDTVLRGSAFDDLLAAARSGVIDEVAWSSS